MTMTESEFYIALIIIVVASWSPVCWILLYLERKFPRLFRWHVPILLFVPVCVAFILNIPNGYVVMQALGSSNELRETFLFSEVISHTLNSVKTILVPALLAIIVPALLARFVMKVRRFGLEPALEFLFSPLIIFIAVIVFLAFMSLSASAMCTTGLCEEIQYNIPPTVTPTPY